jgi:phage-related protein
MAVTNAITDLIKSVGELLSSVFGAAYAIVHSFISGVVGLFAGFFALVADLAKGMVDLTGGVGKFVAGRFFFFRAVQNGG